MSEAHFPRYLAQQLRRLDPGASLLALHGRTGASATSYVALIDGETILFQYCSI
jgi:hypothetical protein